MYGARHAGTAVPAKASHCRGRAASNAAVRHGSGPGGRASLARWRRPTHLANAHSASADCQELAPLVMLLDVKAERRVPSIKLPLFANLAAMSVGVVVVIAWMRVTSTNQARQTRLQPGQQNHRADPASFLDVQTSVESMSMVQTTRLGR